MINKLKRIIRKLIEQNTVPSEEEVLRSVQRRVGSLPAADALRFLFNLDAYCYILEAQKGAEYEGGLHPKHRLMRYHDFFVLRVKPGERILDIGCGNGALAYDVAEKGFVEVVGIDLNEANIQQAKSHWAHPRISYINGDALKDLPQENFNVVILSNVLEHLPDRPQFLANVQSIIQPKRMLIRVPLFEREWRVPLKKELGVEWRLDLTHETEYTLESFTVEMEQAGLAITHQEVRWGEIWAEVAVL